MARGRFFFWLDYDKDSELLIAEQIDELKSQRLFTCTIRDGIRLIYDLRKGRIDVLLELFPEIRKKFRNDQATSDLENRIQQLERMLLYEKTPPMVAHQSLPEPFFKVEKDTSQDAAKNLLGAMSGLM